MAVDHGAGLVCCKHGNRQNHDHQAAQDLQGWRLHDSNPFRVLGITSRDVSPKSPCASISFFACRGCFLASVSCLNSSRHCCTGWRLSVKNCPRASCPLIAPCDNSDHRCCLKRIHQGNCTQESRHFVHVPPREYNGVPVGTFHARQIRNYLRVYCLLERDLELDRSHQPKWLDLASSFHSAFH